jgi:hypothetical protein
MMKGKLLTFIETEVFRKQIDALGKPDSVNLLTSIQDELLENPERGAVIAETHGARKARVGDPARPEGKSGSYRFIYVYFESHSRIYLLYLYAKKDQGTLTKDQKKALGKVITNTKNALKGDKK